MVTSLVRNSPLDTAKTTPLTMAGGSGEIMSRETHPGSIAGAPFCSTTFHATIAPFFTSPLVAANPAPATAGPAAGASTQRVPAISCQLARAPAVNSASEKAGVLERALSNAPASSRCIRPSLVATAIRFLPLNSNTTGEEVNSCLALYEAFGLSVPFSSATSSPPPPATYKVPSGPAAGPTDPATPDPPDVQRVT